MSNQDFEVVFNTAPDRPIGTIDGFTRKGDADTLIPPGHMKDVLDGMAQIDIQGHAYYINLSGGVTSAEVLPTIGTLASKGVPFVIGEGVFIGRSVVFEVPPDLKRAGYQLAGGSAIGHQFQAETSYPPDTTGISTGKSPATTTEEAKAMLDASFGGEGGNGALVLEPGFMLGKSAVLWCVTSKNTRIASVSANVTIGDEAQVFVPSVGEFTRIASQTIVSPSRGAIGSYRVIEPNREYYAAGGPNQ
jgi:hypothetical protein